MTELPAEAVEAATAAIGKQREDIARRFAPREDQPDEIGEDHFVVTGHMQDGRPITQDCNCVRGFDHLPDGIQYPDGAFADE